MIAFLQGELLERTPARVVVVVGGVGYELLIPVSTFSQLPAEGGQVALQVHTHVREDALQLFGFATGREKLLFEKLISVNGVGPKVALAILSGLAADDLAAAIRGNDLARLTSIPGVGKKTAERLVLELRDKLPAPAPTSAPATVPAGASEDVLSALLNLGYPRPLAEKGIARALAAGTPNQFDALFKECMKKMQ
ncbi:MAG: Holliday junction branch migration protein RuvA [Terriglobales bacterium]